MRLTLTPRQYFLVACVALGTLVLIVFTGAAVRVTGSGLGCPTWPTCEGEVLAPWELHAWIEYGNRLITGLVGAGAIAAGGLAYLRRPFRRDLAILGALLPLGVVAQAILGMWTVQYELAPGFVMAHFGLSMIILVAAMALAWRARYEPDERPRNPDRRAVWATRALFPLGALLIFAGTVASAAGPHAGSAATGELVHRLEWVGIDTMDWAIHWHGRIGTALGVSCVLLWLWLRRRGTHRRHRDAVQTIAWLVAAQGVVGAIQYFNKLPPAVVWVHVVLATAVWLAILWAVLEAGSLPRRPTGGPSAPRLGGEDVDRPVDRHPHAVAGVPDRV
jgi:heme a synthase